MLGRLKMSIGECIGAYLQLSDRIFQKKRHGVTVKGKVQGRFDSDELERAVKEVVTKQGFQEDALLKDTPDALCKVFVCATSKETSETVCLISYKSPRGNSDLLNSVKIWEACRATSAASSFFDPIAIGRYKEEFVDGATGANNPVVELWNQAQLMWGPEPLEGKIQCLVSIGTGIPALRPFGDDVIHIGETLVAIATETEQTAERFQRDKSHLDNNGRYFRFNVDRGLDSIGLEETTKKREIAAATRRYIGSHEVSKRVQACVDSLIGRKSTKLGQEELECLRALRTSNYEQFKDRNPDRFEGTCQWFLQHENFKKWQQSKSSTLLWVSADPGCGKSVLSKTLVDVDLKSTESRTTCYFFFKDDNESQQSTTAALSALLHQLFSQNPSIIHHALSDHNVEGDRLSQSFHKLWGILVKAATDPKAREVVCVLDALDECEESGRYEIIRTLSTFYKQSPPFGAPPPRLKFLVTSRPYFDIERSFAGLTRDFPTIRLQGEKESKEISREIDIVINGKISDLVWEMALNESEQSTLEEGLKNTEHRTYLWLKLILEVVRDEISPTSKRLNRIIHTLPSTVDQAYEAILSKVKDRKRAQKLLHIIIAANRPLSLEEMNIALSIEHQHRSYDDLDLDDSARFESTVKNICGLFVSVIDHKVYLLHQTAKDFLVAKGKISTGGWKHSLAPVESELVMARICITYLIMTTFDGGPNQRHKATYSFLDFTASFWVTHYRQVQGKESQELLQSVLEICQPYSPCFETWSQIYWRVKYRSKPALTNILMVASYFGFEAVVKRLLDTHKADLNRRNNRGETPLWLAVENGHEAVVKQLVKPGQADVNSTDNYGQTPLLLAADTGREALVKLLLENGETRVNLMDGSGGTPLLRAAQNGHAAVVKLLLETGEACVNSMDGSGETPLLRAAQNGHAAVVKLLLETGEAYVNLMDGSGETPLSWAVQNKHAAVVKLLLVTGKVDADSKNARYGRTPLSLAVQNGSMAVIMLLLGLGKADINSRDMFGQTPLSRAITHTQYKVVELLLKTGRADVNSKDSWGRTPLALAIKLNHEALVQLLQSYIGSSGTYDYAYSASQSFTNYNRYLTVMYN
jgi:ankyrin repeat protein